jgi:uncharacterized membrane protein
MADTTQAKPRRRILLIVSLCLNLFLIGVVAAGLVAARQREAMGAGPGNSPFHPRNLAAMLPPAGKDKVEQITRENRSKFMPVLREVRQSRLEAFRVLQQEPLDKAKFVAALDDVRRADAKLADEGQRVVVEILEKLTPEERAIVIEKIRTRNWKRQPMNEAGDEVP